MQFILTSEITEGGVQVWSGINSLSLFEDYRIESLNNNEIAFEINLDHLQRALKSGQTAQDITIKLTKKNGIPFLSLAIEVQVIRSASIAIFLTLTSQIIRIISPSYVFSFSFFFLEHL